MDDKLHNSDFIKKFRVSYQKGRVPYAPQMDDYNGE